MDWWETLLLIVGVVVTVNLIEFVGAKINRRMNRRLGR